MTGKRTFTHALFATLAVVAVGCATPEGPTEPPAGAGPQWLIGDLTSTLNATLLQCTPLPYQSVAVKVGSRGGTVKIGPHTLVIPKGALSGTTVITAEIPSDPVNSIRFGPEGLRFANSTKLTMSYANCDELITAPKRIAFTTEALSILEILTSSDSKKSQTVSAPVDHFSRYAVAW